MANVLLAGCFVLSVVGAHAASGKGRCLKSLQNMVFNIIAVQHHEEIQRSSLECEQHLSTRKVFPHPRCIFRWARSSKPALFIGPAHRRNPPLTDVHILLMSTYRVECGNPTKNRKITREHQYSCRFLSCWQSFIMANLDTLESASSEKTGETSVQL